MKNVIISQKVLIVSFDRMKRHGVSPAIEDWFLNFRISNWISTEKLGQTKVKKAGTAI